MSVNVTGGQISSPTDSEESPIEQFVSLVGSLAEHADAPPSLQEAIEDMGEQAAEYVEDLERRIDEQESEDDEPTVEFRGDEDDEEDESAETMENLWIGGIPIGNAVNDAQKRVTRLKKEVNEEVDEIRERVTDEQNTRAKEDGKIRRRLSHVEDEIDIEPPDAIAHAEGGEDVKHLSKLEQFIRHGPEAVTDGRVYAVHHRAREIALRFGDWGKRISDAHGKRIRLRSKKDDLKTHLEDVRDERLQWGQVYRAMEKLAEYAEGTALTLDEGESDEGKYVLELKIADGRGPSFAKEAAV